MKANEEIWLQGSINLGIYATFTLDTCEQVAESCTDGKTDRETLLQLAGAFTVHDHWHTRALMLENALPKLDVHLRKLAESVLEYYRKAADVLWETVGLMADELQSIGIFYGVVR